MNYEIIPYTATSISIMSRFIFVYILYKNKSKNNLSLIFCLFNIVSSCLWLKYSLYLHDNALIYRNCTDISLLFVGACYILRNKYILHGEVAPYQITPPAQELV